MPTEIEASADSSGSGSAASPLRLLSHSRTAALLCLIAIAFHLAIGFRGPGHVVFVELALALYGTTAAVLAFAAGGLRRSDRAWLRCAAAVYLLTVAWAVLVPSLN